MNIRLPHQIPTLHTLGHRYAFELWLAAAALAIVVAIGTAYLLTSTMGPLS